jgi:nicotinic acid mononucleotide adenylyltransferase
MCRIAFGDINKVTVSDAEKKSFERMAKTLSEGEKEKLRAGTADLLEMLREEEPDADFSFCLGADTFLDLTSFKWKRSREVLQLLEGRLVVLSRRGTNFDIRKLVYKVNELDGMKAMLIEVPTLTDISSSLIRSCAEEEILKQSLQMGVLDYIKENKLYSYASDSVDNEI